jgi:YD repeat-containing protein
MFRINLQKNKIMKFLYKSLSFSLLLGIGMVLLQSCDWFKKQEPTPQKVCKLVSEKDGSFLTTHEYNAQDQVTRTIETSGSSTSNATYTYDANGFLTNYNQTNGSRTSNVRLTYSNGFISSWVEQSNSTTSTATFEYSSGQKLSKITIQQSNGSREIYSFSNDKLIGYAERSASGVETQPWVIENGLVKRENSTSGNYSVNEYDAQGRRIRREVWQSGRMQSYTTTEFDANGKNPEELNPIFLTKGWPSIKVLGIVIEYRPGLRSKETIFRLNGSLMQKTNELIYNNALNTNGFPLLVNISSTSFSSTGAATGTSNRQIVYTYSDCD